jgi:hypothetical protein
MLNANQLASEMADRMISELGIPEVAREKFCQWAFILADTLINHFKENAEIDISNIQIQVNNVFPGDMNIDAQKQGTGKIK